ncbi:metalloproteinase inhibitor 3-like [Anneissia japonica]|uniref:metalloproteinase inhibitor 3-like n=1 Tax=Anneissia japonica TaxID=1529436 RepID=UPI0014257E03|nr:metalloproteinase inhibitor 3-like [Anneissia japonica]
MKVLVLLLVVCSLQASLACMCAWETPQQKFCRADFAIRGRVISTSPQGQMSIKYLVRVTEIYKGADLMPAQDVEILTASFDSLCGIPGLQVNTEYLLTGHKSQGDLTISICNWIEKYDDLTSSTRQSLTAVNCDDTV